MNRRERRLVNRGEGYWVYDVEVTEPTQVAMATEATSIETQTYDIQTVYRPVIVESDGDSVYAYYFDGDADPMKIFETDGKRYVPIQQVRLHPPDNAEPAYRHEETRSPGNSHVP